jgi:hypothetical protein
LASGSGAEEGVERALDWLFRHVDSEHPLFAELRRLARARMLRHTSGESSDGG